VKGRSGVDPLLDVRLDLLGKAWRIGMTLLLSVMIALPHAEECPGVSMERSNQRGSIPDTMLRRTMEIAVVVVVGQRRHCNHYYLHGHYDSHILGIVPSKSMIECTGLRLNHCNND
jgi:hypothetical protein